MSDGHGAPVQIVWKVDRSSHTCILASLHHDVGSPARVRPTPDHTGIPRCRSIGTEGVLTKSGAPSLQ